MTTPTPEEVRVPSDPSADASAVRRGQTTKLDPHMHFVVSKPQISIRTTTIGHAVLAPPPAAVKIEPAPLSAGERKRNAREMDSIGALPVATQPLTLDRPKSTHAATREMSPEERQRAMAELNNLALLPALPQAATRSVPQQPDLPTRPMSMEEMLTAPADPPFLGHSAQAVQLAPVTQPLPRHASSSLPEHGPAPVKQLEIAPTELMDAVGFRPRKRGSRPFLLVTMSLLALGVTGGSIYLKQHPALLQPHTKPLVALMQRGVKLARAAWAPAKPPAKPRRAAPKHATAGAQVTQLVSQDVVHAEPVTKRAKGASPKQLARKAGPAARQDAREDEAVRAPKQTEASEAKAGSAGQQAHAAEQTEASEAKAGSAGQQAFAARQTEASETKAGSAGQQAFAARQAEANEPAASGSAPAREASGALFASPHAAAELYIAGRYKEALAEYRTLATLSPDVRAYAQFARILHKRLVEICVRTQPHRQTECEQL